MRDDHLWAAVKITEAAVTQLFNGASTPNEVRRGLQIGEIVAELYTAISAGIVEADYRVGRIAAADSSDQETQPNAPILESKRSPNRRSPNRRSPNRRSPNRRSPNRRSPNRRSPNRRSPNRRSPNRRNPNCRIPKPLRLPKGEDWLLPFRA